MNDPKISLTFTEPKEENIHVVRLRTSYWSDKYGIHIKKDLITLKNKSKGYRVLEEDASIVGAEEVIGHIINLNSCEDGIYFVITCNEVRDWESNSIEDYDFKLVPYLEENRRVK